MTQAYWKIEKSIPHCSNCGYEPPLKGFTRDCPNICPQCGAEMVAKSKQIGFDDLLWRGESDG